MQKEDENNITTRMQQDSSSRVNVETPSKALLQGAAPGLGFIRHMLPLFACPHVLSSNLSNSGPWSAGVVAFLAFPGVHLQHKPLLKYTLPPSTEAPSPPHGTMQPLVTILGLSCQLSDQQPLQSRELPDDFLNCCPVWVRISSRSDTPHYFLTPTQVRYYY